MILFLDTEFTDFQQGELISIALVGLDEGCSIYLEVTDFDYELCSDFVRSNVWAHLGLFPQARVKREELSARLRAWCLSVPVEAMLASDSQRDVDLLLRSLGPNHGLQVAGRVDLRPMLNNPQCRAAMRRFHATGKPQHHALYDAQALRAGWLAAQAGVATIPEGQ